MKKLFKYFIIIIIAILFMLLYFHNEGVIGVTKNGVEADARMAHHIREEWLVEKDITKSMAALVFYPENLSKYVLAIHVNKPGLSFGYHFKQGGGGSIDEKPYLYEFKFRGIEDRAFILINKQYISKVEVDDGINVETIKIGRKTPCVLILSKKFDSLRFYDIVGKEVEVEVVRRGLY